MEAVSYPEGKHESIINKKKSYFRCSPQWKMDDNAQHILMISGYLGLLKDPPGCGKKKKKGGETTRWRLGLCLSASQRPSRAVNLLSGLHQRAQWLQYITESSRETLPRWTQRWSSLC